jgi:transcriptional regulator with XRE-family HTH domain
MRRAYSAPRRRSEADQFRRALLSVRTGNAWTQEQLAARLGVSKRTLSNWECGYWLPPHKQRLHLVLALRDQAPEHVLEVADGLGVSVDPATVPFLQPYRDALAPPPPEPPPPPAPVVLPQPPPRVPTDPELLRKAMDAVLRDAADAMNVATNELRAAVARAITGCAELGGTLEEMRDAVAVRPKPGGAKRP